LGTIQPPPTPTVPNQLGTIEPSPTPTVPNQLGTIEPSPTPTVPNQLGTIQPSPAPEPPKVDCKWNKGNLYYYLRPYINGNRESFYLGSDLSRANAKAIVIASKIASGKTKPEILANLEREFPKKVKSYSMMVT
jgi:hypothetical protein